MEFSNRRSGLGYQYYSNEYYSLLALIAYGVSDKHCHMEPYGRHSWHNDNTTKFRVIPQRICFWRRAVFEFGSVSHSLANLWRLAVKAKKIDSDQSDRTMTNTSRAEPFSRDASQRTTNKQQKNITLKILCIHNQIENSDRDWYQNSINSWTQTWPNKYSLDCPSSRSWNQLDSGSQVHNFLS